WLAGARCSRPRCTRGEGSLQRAWSALHLLPPLLLPPELPLLLPELFELLSEVVALAASSCSLAYSSSAICGSRPRRRRANDCLALVVTPACATVTSTRYSPSCWLCVEAMVQLQVVSSVNVPLAPCRFVMPATASAIFVSARSTACDCSRAWTAARTPLETSCPIAAIEHTKMARAIKTSNSDNPWRGLVPLPPLP